MNKEVIKLGTKNVDFNKLTVLDAISIPVVVILSVTIGVIYGSVL